MTKITAWRGATEKRRNKRKTVKRDKNPETNNTQMFSNIREDFPKVYAY